MSEETEENGRVVQSPKGGPLLPATPAQAARARRGLAEIRRQRREAAERIARETLSKMVEELPADQVKRYVIRKGREYLLVWGAIVERQAWLALEGAKGSTGAARFVGVVAGLLAVHNDNGEALSVSEGGNDEALSELAEVWRQAKLNNPELAAKVELLRESKRDSDEY